MRTLIALVCLLPWLTLAQVPIMPGGAVPWYKAPSGGFNGNPLSIPGVAYRFVSTNLSINEKATNWFDQVASYKMESGKLAPGLIPSNEVNGVFFSWDAMSLTNIAPALGSNAALFMVFKMQRNHTIAGLRGATLANAVGATPDAGVILGDANTNSLAWTKSTLPSASINFVSNNFPTNVYLDFCLTWKAANSNFIAYANGVEVTNVITAAVTNATGRYNKFSNTAGPCFAGWISEIVGYTQTVSAVNASNLHWYRTQQWP